MPRSPELDIVSLPTDKQELGDVLRNAITYGERIRNVQAVKWGMVRLWLQGIRDFTILNGMTGEAAGEFVTPGDMLVLDTALSACQEEIGRLSKLSLKPVVSPLPIDLDGVRKAAMGHLFLTYHSPRMGYETARRTHDNLLVHYGTVGVSLLEGPTLKGREEEWRPRYGIIPPWELLSIPGDVPHPNDVRAIVRQRWVPLSWLKALAKTSKNGGIRPELTIPDNEADMYSRSIPFGGNHWGPSGSYSLPMELNGNPQIFGTQDNSKQFSGSERFVQLSEIQFSHDHLHLDRYVMLAGRCVIGDRNYWTEGLEVWNTTGISRYAEIGSFYGKSFAESKIEINRIVEMMTANFVRNAEDMDAFGLVLVPRNAGIKRHELLRRRDGGPRVATYQPDPMVQHDPVINIQPATTGDFPAKVASVIAGVGQQVFPQRSIFSPDAPQRADSNEALGTIDNAANEARTPTSDYMVEAFNTVHRAVLDSGRRRYPIGSSAVLPITALDTAIVGVVYDRELGGVKLDQSIMPMPDEVRISVESRTPRDKNILASHLWQCVQTGIMTPRQFRTRWRLSDIDLPVDNEAEWASFQHAQLNLIIAYGDGKTPGGTDWPETGTGVADVHRAVYTAFMADVRYTLASKEVRAAIQWLFNRYSQDLPPDGMDTGPHMEDEAAAMGGSPGRASVSAMMDQTGGR